MTLRIMISALESGTVARCTAPLDPGFRRDDDGCAHVPKGEDGRGRGFRRALSSMETGECRDGVSRANHSSNGRMGD